LQDFLHRQAGCADYACLCRDGLDERPGLARDGGQYPWAGADTTDDWWRALYDWGHLLRHDARALHPRHLASVHSGGQRLPFRGRADIIENRLTGSAQEEAASAGAEPLWE